MVQAFNIPSPVNYLGNAMQINRQNAQQDQQNALMQRDQAIQEQQFQGQQQDRQTAQAAAQRKLQVDARLAAIRTLKNMPEAQRGEAFQRIFIADRDWAGAAGADWVQSVSSNPLALTDAYLTMGENSLGSQTQDQEIDLTRRKKEAETVPTWEWVRGPNGQPMRRAINPFSDEAGKGVVGSADPNSIMTNNTSRSNNAATNATSRANNLDSNATSRRGQNMTAATADERRAVAEEKARNPPPKAMTATERNRVAAKLTSVNLLRQRLNDVKTAWARIQDGPLVGPLGGRVPLTEDGQRFDRAISRVSPFITQVTRTPGVGAMSDYESRLQELSLPNRSDRKEATADSIAALEELVNGLEAGYLEMRDGSGQPAGLAPGAVEGGYRFMGGDPANPKNWKPQ
jgi:hypothetical protein